ncbi:MAG: acyl--CoA ligase [Candidatus Pacebacteria bacterium]|nr:acyl--CoA ligase [Candidatus Paceibacterota bacterium]MBP9700852.1 acyl--CoA ligase [Candidatus Paceibacterota bacterium]
MDVTLYKNPILINLKNVLTSPPSKELLTDYRGRGLTSEQIIDSIEKIAITLSMQGIQKDDRVVFLAQPSIESILYFFALIRVGACIVLADPEMGQANFIDRVTFSKARWVLQDSILEKVEKYSFVKPLLRFLKIWFPEHLPISNDKRITIEKLQTILAKDISKYVINEKSVNEDGDLAIIFTSGTTGTPKGVVHSYNSLYAGIKLIISKIPIDSSDYVYASQLYFLLIALNIPAKVYVPKSKAFTAKNFITIVKRQNITSTFLLPYEGQKIYTLCSSKKEMLPESLRTVLFGSAPVTKGFLSRFKTITPEQVKVFGVYGATEMLIISTVLMEDKLAYTGDGDFLGTPLPAVKVQISDEHEMLIAGPQMYTHYLGDSKAEFFFSGDLGTVNENGSIVMLGRKKDMIIRKGYNLYPGIFESTISKIPGIQECAIVGQYDDATEDEKVILFIVKETNSTISQSDIETRLRNGQYSIDAQAFPDAIIFINELPRSGRSKKVSKAELRKNITTTV